MRAPRLLLIDNYDSFTWNLVQYLETVGAAVQVERNDALPAAALAARAFDAVVLSPGPGTPADAGVCVDLVRRLYGTRPLLGVCLGHQAIAVAYGGTVRRAARVMHGKTSRIRHDGAGIFADVPSPCEAMRYHSLVVDRDALPACLAVVADTDDGEVMAVRHRDAPVHGVQFHPESIGTPAGLAMLDRFVTLVRQRAHRSAA